MKEFLGQSEGNIAKIHQDSEVKLSRKGISQAEDVAKRFSNINIDIILASDYIRAYKTAKIIKGNKMSNRN